mgnify:CR=1 FL=1
MTPCTAQQRDVARDAEQATRRQAMVADIDAVLSRAWEAAGVTPAPLADDSEFLRRVYLDLTGVIPKVSEARAFLRDSASDKRARLVEHLLASPTHATHMANTWRRIMLPGNLSDEQLANVAGVQNWLRGQFVENMRYDRMVGDLLVATGSGNTGPGLYYTALELKPEKLAASTARIFLGLQMDCAQCHDHPFDDWTQQDFWGYAAFFAQLGDAGNSNLIDQDRGEVTLPDTETVVMPKFPGGERASQDGEFGSRRDKLAVWMASRGNEYLPKAAVNRVWAHLFGRGIVDPVDDLGRHNAPSHPQLFERLSTYFVRSGYDLRELLRTLTETKAYQRSSRVSGAAPDPAFFAVMAIKPLTAEQLYDSLAQSLGEQSTSTDESEQRRRAFLAKMQSQSRDATEFDAGVTQALTLMNGDEVAHATDPARSRVLSALQSPLFQTEKDVLDVLFLATLSRFPSSEETREIGKYLAQAERGQPQQQARADVLWALLNSAEFALNH